MMRRMMPYFPLREWTAVHGYDCVIKSVEAHVPTVKFPTLWDWPPNRNGEMRLSRITPAQSMPHKIVAAATIMTKYRSAVMKKPFTEILTAWLKTLMPVPRTLTPSCSSELGDQLEKIASMIWC